MVSFNPANTYFGFLGYSYSGYGYFSFRKLDKDFMKPVTNQNILL